MTDPRTFDAATDSSHTASDGHRSGTVSTGPCSLRWEEAYRRFETPAEEVRKFRRRLRRLGAAEWPAASRIVELFCGRGNGLAALAEMGFSRIEGIDISARLLADYDGPARCYVSDCRHLPFATASRDVLIVQGGLHHLPDLQRDLPRVLQECRRGLVHRDILVVVEPWPTPFLHFVHVVCRRPWARRLNARVEALATMIAQERATYEDWLRQPEWILSALKARFLPRTTWRRWGKLFFVGEKTL